MCCTWDLNLRNNKVGTSPNDQKALDDLYKIAESRYKNKIPPGYLDENKNDICIDSTLIYKKKFGDYMVWHQILEHAKNQKITDVIFITNDLKEDWWKKYDVSGEKFNQPRPELIDEALNIGGIQNFIMYDSGRFLSHSSKFLNIEISDSSVKEIRDTIEIYNERNLKKTINIPIQFDLKKISDGSVSIFDEIRKKIAFDKVKKHRSQIAYEIYKNKGLLDHPTDVLECPECQLDTMIPDELSSTGYKCTYCGNQESDEIEIECTMCGQTWPSSEIEDIPWTDEGHIESVCPYCRRDPDYVGDD